MPKTYRIYPGIGIARLGNSPNSFFIAPEVPGLGPLELAPDGTFDTVKTFKDNQHQIRRQAARFRIFEFDSDTNGVREINADAANVEWEVELANEKAVAGRFLSESIPENSGQPRNPGINEDDLIIKPIFPKISGRNQAATATNPGHFKGKEVFLGELRTDEKGRLLVLGGHGQSSSIPNGLPVGGGTPFPHHPQNNFANNEGWHDDTADGPVSATVTFAGQAPIHVTDGWVIVAPPDYAAFTLGITTLYDIAFQAAVENHWFQTPAQPAYKSDILPILQAVSGLRWVSDLSIWEQIPRDWDKLAEKGTPESDKLRHDTFSLVMSIEGGPLQNFRFTDTQRSNLRHWSDGNFVNDHAAADPAAAITPDGLDLASLVQTIGGGFFPGIEAGIRMTYKEMYSAPYRLTRTPFQSHGSQFTPRAGFVTRNMACPWQSDFLKCASETTTSVWWPAQRPIDVFVKTAAAGLVRKDWTDGINNHQDLVNGFGLLGFVRPDDTGNALIEVERDAAVPHP